jgi:hypothetical protein
VGWTVSASATYRRNHSRSSILIWWACLNWIMAKRLLDKQIWILHGTQKFKILLFDGSKKIVESHVFRQSTIQVLTGTNDA